MKRMFVFNFLGRIALCLLVVASVATVIASDSRNEARESAGVQVKGSLEVPIPSKLRALQMENPFINYLVEVDSRGELSDFMPVEATHFGLLERGARVIKKLTYSPEISGGEPVRSRINVFVRFYDPDQRALQNGFSRSLSSVNTSDAIDRRMYVLNPSSFEFSESNRKELDAPLAILESSRRVFTSVEGEVQEGKCLVEYFVGPEGRTHFPLIIESDHEDLSISVLLTLEATKFAPPTAKGNPTFVLVKQPFYFQ